ncbi:MAG: hypothetical protein RR426_09835, partial [Oscillospiraceae bacterium]
MLQLHGFSGNPCSDERAIQNALRKIKNNPDFSSGECVELLEKAADFGISFAAGCSEKKRAFLQDIAKGKDKDFLQEVAETYKRSRGTADTRGKCGYSIGSSDYLTHMERAVFQRDLPVMNSARWGNPNYDALLTDALEAIAHRLERDLETNERDNNYITDGTAARLKDVVSELAACGVGSGFLSSKIDKLAWFVGGDATKIRQLQGKLNELGVGGHLTEDGVYGRETLAAWERYWKDLTRGTVPTLTWIDPLQSNLTGITIGNSRYGKLHNLNNALMTGLHPYIRIDPKPNGTETAWVHGVKTNIHYPHINFDKTANSNWIYDQLQSRFNHYQLDDKAYDVLKDLKATGKKVHVAGKVLLVAGTALDALELGTAIDADVKDADRKLGKKTLSTAASIGGSWAGAALGAKLGALAGAATGPAAPIAVPVLSLAGGIGGSFGGDA